MAPLLLLLALQQTYVEDLQHQDPGVRINALDNIARKRITTAIPVVIDSLGRETDDDARAMAVSALERLTGQADFGPDAARWKTWWNDFGIKIYPVTHLSTEQVHQIMRPTLEDMNDKVEKFKSEIRILSITVGIIATAFVLVMIYFVGHVSSKLKEWKELVRQAGVYIEESNQVTKRTDRVLEELEVKKVDILEFVKKLKEEKESEIDRYAELLQQNTEHKMREEVMALRQKAEKELQETLGQLRQQIELEMRRGASAQKEKVDADVQARHDHFMREVDAHTLFLQAEFNRANGKAEEALRLYKKVVAQKPDHAVAWERMGTACRDLLRFEEALEAYEKAVELAPGDASPRYQMAATFARQRRKDRMLETLAHAIKNDGEFKDEALNDPAFRDYWNDPAFKDLAEA